MGRKRKSDQPTDVERWKAWKARRGKPCEHRNGQLCSGKGSGFLCVCTSLTCREVAAKEADG